MPVQPPPGFSAIPDSKSGGFHKQTAGGWVQWYPDGKSAQAAHEHASAQAGRHPPGSPGHDHATHHADQAKTEMGRHADGGEHPHAQGDPAQPGQGPPGEEQGQPGAPGQEEGGGQPGQEQQGKRPHDTPYIDPATIKGELRQEHDDEAKLFAGIDGAHAEQVKMLNEGTGLDAAIGAGVVRLDQIQEGMDRGQFPSGPEGEKAYNKALGKAYGAAIDKQLAQDGPLVVIGPLKNATQAGRDRIKEKVEGDYDGDFSQITDLVRATVAVNSFDDLPGVMAQLEAAGMEFAQVKDRFQSAGGSGAYKTMGPTPAGYRDINMKVRYQGHVSELQIHVKPILKVKEEAHQLYNKTRAIKARLKKEGRTSMTPEEEQTYNEANAKSMKLYGDAWAEAIKGTPMEAMAKALIRRMRKAEDEDEEDDVGKDDVGKDDGDGAKDGAKKVEYYEYKDQPAYKVEGQVPMRIGKKGPKPIWDLERFAHEAGHLEKEDFDQLVEAMKKDETSMAKAIRLLGIRFAEARGIDVRPLTER